MQCNNECEFADDGFCDDGGSMAEGGVESAFSDCALGTDCADCAHAYSNI
jgi:hypothetical protein